MAHKYRHTYILVNLKLLNNTFSISSTATNNSYPRTTIARSTRTFIARPRTTMAQGNSGRQAAGITKRRTPGMIRSGRFWAERILAEEVRDGERKYKIKWEGLPESDQDWEPVRNLPKSLIDDWEEWLAENGSSDDEAGDSDDADDAAEDEEDIGENIVVASRHVPDSDSESEMSEDLPEDHDDDDLMPDAMEEDNIGQNIGVAPRHPQDNESQSDAPEDDDNANDEGSEADAQWESDDEMQDVSPTHPAQPNATTNAEPSNQDAEPFQAAQPVQLVRVAYFKIHGDQNEEAGEFPAAPPGFQPCNDPIQHRLGLANHDHNFHMCEDPNHAGLPVMTCTWCHTTAVPHLNPDQLDAYLNGAFFRVCFNCIQAELDKPTEEFQTCTCQDTPRCSNCLHVAMTSLALSKTIASAEQHVRQGLCLQCQEPLNPTYVRYMCAACYNPRI